jgi:hypothetical protein
LSSHFRCLSYLTLFRYVIHRIVSAQCTVNDVLSVRLGYYEFAL